LFLVAYFAPESPWNAVRRGKIDEARHSLMRLATASADKEAAVEASLAYIRHTTELEKAETQGASFWECFKGTNLRRTEIVCIVPPRSTHRANRLELRRLGGPNSLR
jgi:SP family general alpha glucoside:H+ symporter-like MFS transporter